MIRRPLGYIRTAGAGKGLGRAWRPPGQYQIAQEGGSKLKLKYHTLQMGDQLGTGGPPGGGGYRAPLTLGAYFFFLLVRPCSRRGAGVLGRGGTAC